MRNIRIKIADLIYGGMPAGGEPGQVLTRDDDGAAVWQFPPGDPETLPSADQIAALDGANNPSAENPFATIADLDGATVDEVTDAAAGTAPAMAEAAVGSVLLRAGADDPVWRRLTLDDIDPAFAAALSGGTTLEVGASAVNPALTASYTGGPPTSASVSDSDGNPATTLSSPFTDATIARTYTKTANNASVTWTLSAVKGSLTRTATTSTAWRPRVYYGVGVDGLSTETAIEALASSALASSRARSFTVAPGSGEHIYYAFPASYGEAVFTVGGFEGGFELVSDSISVTNANGVTQNYRLYKSTNPNLGSTTVVVT